ncbi:MAG: protein-L-isoaspartate(D-aspartate) O-methyltransferase [Prevotellaceae bacterium]|jgi:protein-L-isoaspartate(D-aspartate) O-methyltransferase|nr:protein-L-isoaspartate(D-aspartate) O-methyltransferase [Prevotellaceae bacterium]
MTDSFLHKGLRKKLVDELRTKGIDNEIILAAIGKVPRHFFVDGSFARDAYEDKPFSIGAGQTISQPFTVAFQTQLLDVKKFDKVLEIGTGSGYQTAILLELGATVYTIERQRELFVKYQQILMQMNYQPYSFLGDGYEGKPVFAPFNRILITAGAKTVPQKLLEQLAVGGRMVIPVGDSETQEMTVIDKLSADNYKTAKFGKFSFVPMLHGTVNS